MATASIPRQPVSVSLPVDLRLGLLRRLAGCAVRWSTRSPLDARTRYLSQSSDHVDLEARMRSWDRHERQQALLNLVL